MNKKAKLKTLAIILIALTTIATASFSQVEFDIDDISASEVQQCGDAYDQERDGNADGDGEIGCTYPLWNAKIEGNTWNTMASELILSQQAPSGTSFGNLDFKYEASRFLSTNSSWTEVNFANNYDNPVIVGTTNTKNGESGLIFEAKDVTSTSAKMRVCQLVGGAQNCDNDHSTEQVGYLVVDASDVDDVDGLDAGKTSADTDFQNNPESISFNEAFDSSPHVFTSVQTKSSTSNPLEGRISDDGSGSSSIDTNGFEGGLCMHGSTGNTDNCDGGTTEQFGWIAIEPGTNPFNEPATSGSTQTQDNTWVNIGFGSTFDREPVVIAERQTDNGGQEVEIDELRSIGETGAQVRMCEIDGNTCDSHNSGQTAYLAIEGYFNFNARPKLTHAVYPSVTLRGNETLLRNAGTSEVNNTPLNQEFIDENGNSLSNEFWENGTGIQNFTTPANINTELMNYSQHNLTFTNNTVSVPPYTYVQEIEFTDSVDETTTNYNNVEKWLEEETIQRPLRRDLAQDGNQDDSTQTITTHSLVYPPHRIQNHYPGTSDDGYERVRRGNGFMDNVKTEADNYKVNNYAFGDEAETGGPHHGERIEWKADYGRPLQKEAMHGQYVNVPLDKEGYRCLDDKADCESGSSSCDACETGKPDGGECTRFDGGSNSFVSCSSSSTKDVSTSNEYYHEKSRDVIEYRNCENTGTVTTCSGASSSNCGKKSANKSCSSQTKSYGDTYDWNDNTLNCDEEFSTVDGGADGIGNNPAATFTKFTVHTDSSWTNQTYNNDAYNSGGSIWCGWNPDKTITINADGPNGRGDGWIVINETQSPSASTESDYVDRVVARLGPYGDNMVGRNVYTRRGTYLKNNNAPFSNDDLTRVNNDYINHVFPSGEVKCPGDKVVCAAYVNFETDSQGWSWQGDLNSTIHGSLDWQDAVVHNFTADESYGSCKLINRIYRNDPSNDMNEEILTCDYKQSTDDGSRKHISGPKGLGKNGLSASPLPQACGDDQNEVLFAMAGPEVDHDRMNGIGYDHGYLNHHQKCAEIGEDETVNELRGDNIVREDSCLNKGHMYKEGTVLPVRRQRPDYNYSMIASSGIDGDPDDWDLNRDYNTSAESPRTLEWAGSPAQGPPVYETNGTQLQESPDWEVCLNIDAESSADFGNNDEDTGLSRGSEKQGIGGQWYDLDDKRATEFLRTPEGQSLITNGDRFNRNDIAYYWRRNMNPMHSVWNPEGEDAGVALESDCGNPHPRVDSINCSDSQNPQGDINYELSWSYNFFREAGGFNQDKFEQEIN